MRSTLSHCSPYSRESPAGIQLPSLTGTGYALTSDHLRSLDAGYYDSPLLLVSTRYSLYYFQDTGLAASRRDTSTRKYSRS